MEKYKPLWPKSRMRELEQLQDLLNDIESINSGNKCLERIARCIRTARKLNRSSLRTGRAAFPRFLISMAWGDEQEPKP